MIGIDCRDRAACKLQERCTRLGSDCADGGEGVLDGIRPNGQVIRSGGADRNVSRQVPDVNSPVSRAGELVAIAVPGPSPIDRVTDGGSEGGEGADRCGGRRRTLRRYSAIVAEEEPAGTAADGDHDQYGGNQHPELPGTAGSTAPLRIRGVRLRV